MSRKEIVAAFAMCQPEYLCRGEVLEYSPNL